MLWRTLVLELSLASVEPLTVKFRAYLIMKQEFDQDRLLIQKVLRFHDLEAGAELQMVHVVAVLYFEKTALNKAVFHEFAIPVFSVTVHFLKL